VVRSGHETVYILSGDFVCRIAEYLSGGGVERFYMAALVNRDNAVYYIFECGLIAQVGVIPLGLAIALEQLLAQIL
jgi:hypothetical protein